MFPGVIDDGIGMNAQDLDRVFGLFQRGHDPQRYPVAGKVAWLTPPNASGGRTQGVGVRFPNDEKTRPEGLFSVVRCVSWRSDESRGGDATHGKREKT